MLEKFYPNLLEKKYHNPLARYFEFKMSFEFLIYKYSNSKIITNVKKYINRIMIFV